MLATIRRYFDKRAERAAIDLLAPDLDVIHRFEIAVTNNNDSRRGNRAVLAPSGYERPRKAA